MNPFKFLRSFFRSSTAPRSLIGLEGVEKADTTFKNLVTENKIPGASVTMLQNGEPILQKGYGFSNIEAATSVDPKHTLFRMASISKCITALALGKMVEEGLLGWDDSFYKHVPNYPKKRFDFTLRQLASHTAGLRSYRGKEYALNKLYSIEDGLQIFKDDPLVFEPGKGYLYNSFDFVLLSLAMQQVSGIPFEEYVNEKILIPLGMNNTFAPNELKLSFRAEREISIADFYTKSSTGFKKATEVNNFYKIAGGGYLSTSDDVAKLGQTILDRNLLRPRTYRELLTAQLVNGKSTYYGLGFQVSQDAEGRPFVGHVGNSIGAYTNFFVYPQQRMVCSILINCTDPKVQPWLDGAKSKLLEMPLV